MAWYDYINPLNTQHGLGAGLNKLGLNGLTPGAQGQVGKLNDVGGNAATLADDAHVNYQGLTGRLGGALDNLQGQMNGENSVSALQLHQALQQNLANQQAQAAGAAPGNQAMAARTAMNNMGKLGYGLSGQQAMAGLQERNQAGQLYASLLGSSRGQDAQTALGGYGTAAGAYGGGLSAQQGAPTLGGSLLGAAEGVAGWAMKGGGKPSSMPTGSDPLNQSWRRGLGG